MISFFMWFRSSSSPTFFAARASYSLRKAEGSWTDTLPPISETVHTLSVVREVVNARRVQTDRSGLRVVAGERGSVKRAREGESGINHWLRRNQKNEKRNRFAVFKKGSI